ncbi:hypothetical protein ACQCX2_07835 [Propionibacteriaceae bacterium Y1700]|uniref:hypothetical protein n=1 Tax=Microlunatus sp. Y1700 TaxID=3418487 RepID=UPI003DA78ED1
MMTKKVLTTWAVAVVAGMSTSAIAVGAGVIGGDPTGAGTPPPTASSPTAPESPVDSSTAAPSPDGSPTSPADSTPESSQKGLIDDLFLTEDDVDSADNPVSRTLHEETDKMTKGAMSDDSYNPCFNGYGMLKWAEQYREQQGKQDAPTPEVLFAVFAGTKITAAQTVLRGEPGDTDLAREMYENATHLNTICSVESGDFRTSDPRSLSADNWTGTWYKVYEGDKRTASMRVAVVRAGENVSTIYFAGDGKDKTTDALLVQAASRLQP